MPTATDIVITGINASDLTQMEPDLSGCETYPALKVFNEHYKPIHAYLSLSICLFGTFTNTLNAVILTHRSMRSPTNSLLTAIALSDSMTMLAYVAKDVYLHFVTSPDPVGAPHGLAATYFILMANFVTIGSHIFATIMTVMLAAFRCWVLYRPRTQVTYRHIQRTVLAAALLSIAMSGMGVSAFVPILLRPPLIPENSTEDFYWFEVRTGLDYLDRASFAIYGCFSKLASSILISIFIGFILVAMDRARRRYLKLKQYSKNEPLVEHMDGTERSLQAQKKRETRGSQRTTVMLIAVVVSFIITEAPQGVINTVVAIKGDCFLFHFYVPIGDLLDLLVLLNSSTNFILYCAMSAQFRRSFKQLVMDEIVCCCRQRKSRSHQHDVCPPHDDAMSVDGAGNVGRGFKRPTTVILTHT